MRSPTALRVCLVASGFLLALGSGCNESATSSGSAAATPFLGGGGGSFRADPDDGSVSPADPKAEPPAPPSSPSDPPPPPVEEPTGAGGIQDLRATVLSPRAVEVSWTTDEMAGSVVEFGESPELEVPRTAQGRVDRYHRVLLKGLSAGVTYHYRAISEWGGTSVCSEVRAVEVPDVEPVVVRAGHPRIYFTADDLPELRERIAGSHARYWRALQSACDAALARDAASIASEVNAHFHGQALAFAAALTGDPDYAAKAEQVALASSKLALTETMAIRKSLLLQATTYDWLHARLSSGSRSALRSGILARMAALGTNDREWLWGWNPEKFGPLTVGAIALHGEAAEADARLEECVFRYRHSIFPAWRHFAQSGGTMEGWWYSIFHVDIFLDAILALRSATNVDFLESETWLADMTDWFCRGLRSNDTFQAFGDTWVSEGFVPAHRRVAACVARHFRDPQAQWLAARAAEVGGVWGPTAVGDVLLYDPTVPAEAPSGAPGGFSPDAGFVLEADGWGPDAVQLAFRSSREFTLGHTHRDDNSFTIHFRGGQAIDSGIYDSYTSDHHMNYYERSVAHNTIVVFDPGETFRRYCQCYANDGGQQWLRSPEEVEWVMPGSVEDILDPTQGYQRGGIRRYERNDLYTYALGDAAPSYSREKLRVFDRHIVFLRTVAGLQKPVVVVFDRVVTTRPELRKTYLLHTQNEPRVAGTRFSATNGCGMLFHDTLLPVAPRISVVGGPGREYWVNGRNYPPTRFPKATEEAGQYRVEVSPSVPALEDFFLHVLHAAEAGSPQPPAALAVEADGAQGLEVGDWTVLFASGDGALSSVEYSAPAGAARHLFVGLAPRARYGLELGGVAQGELESSGEGTLVYEVVGPALVKLARSD